MEQRIKQASSVRVGDIVGNVITGYQGWFNAEGDESDSGWVHWSRRRVVPTAGSDALTFELYPDMREYTKVYETQLGKLGNGEPARLFSSYDQSTVDKHFEWMRDYGIHGVGLQRFGASDSDEPNVWRGSRDSVVVKVKQAAEAYGRKFYVMYDTSGMKDDNWVKAIKHDWTVNIVGKMNLTASSAYAKQDGKLVICIWGMGFTDRPGTVEEAAGLISWFKEQGFYVIGGIPTNWRECVIDSKPDFQDVYQSLDMISPWFVGRFSGLSGADEYLDKQWKQDFAQTQSLGIDYMPVIWPGFAWWNLHSGPRNQIPRLHGDFLWRQAYNLKSIGIDTAYIAMFDEYDEGTAIAKAAEDASMSPTDHYFLTLDADGVAVSADFYLRLSGDITKLIRGEIPLTEEHPTPHKVKL
jgi:hypothetical protein